MKVLLIFLLTLSLTATSLKNTNHGNVIVDEITSIYDGDTFRVNLKGYPSIIGNKIAIRVNGIDTPELRGKCKNETLLAMKAKQFTVNFLRSGKNIELRNMKRGKYFRIVADVYSDGKSLSKELLKSGLAVKYNGGHKYKNWCKK